MAKRLAVWGGRRAAAGKHGPGVMWSKTRELEDGGEKRGRKESKRALESTITRGDSNGFCRAAWTKPTLGKHWREGEEPAAEKAAGEVDARMCER